LIAVIVVEHILGMLEFQEAVVWHLEKANIA
jgi:hypothetical protein